MVMVHFAIFHYLTPTLTPNPNSNPNPNPIHKPLKTQPYPETLTL